MWRISSSHWTPSKDFFFIKAFQSGLYQIMSKQIVGQHFQIVSSIFKLFQHLRLFWAISLSGNFTFPQVKTESDIICCTNLICAKIFSDQLDASLAHDVGSEVLGVEASTGGKLCRIFWQDYPAARIPSSNRALCLDGSCCDGIWANAKLFLFGAFTKQFLLEKMESWFYWSDFRADCIRVILKLMFLLGRNPIKVQI